MAHAPCSPTSARRFDAYRVALELVAAVQPLIRPIARLDPDLARQLRKAVASAPQNFAQGMRRTGKDRAHLLTVSLGSADEVRTILDVAMASSLVAAEQTALPDQLADRFCAMAFRVRQKLA